MERIDLSKLKPLSSAEVWYLERKFNNKGIPLDTEDICRILEDNGLCIIKRSRVIDAMQNIIENKPEKIEAISAIFNKFCIFRMSIPLHDSRYVVEPYKMPIKIRRGLIKMSNEIYRDKQNELISKNKQLLDDLQK